MPNTESQKIKIDTVHGQKDKDQLKHCYFYPTSTPGSYNFYTKDDVLLASGVTSGGTFSFNLPNSTITWTIPNPTDLPNPFAIDNQRASGSWKNDDDSASISDDSNGESGTFTAQAGGTIDPAEASAAKA